MLELPFVSYSQPTLPFCGLVILGEAPGAAEAEQRRGFTGRSGELLDKALEASGIDRKACLVANVFRYKPPDNKARLFFCSGRRAAREGVSIDRRYGKHTLGFCLSGYATELDYLALALEDARTVLALGAVATWATTGQSRIKDTAGRMLPCRFPGRTHINVFPTHHPAFLLRGKLKLFLTWQGHIARSIQA